MDSRTGAPWLSAFVVALLIALGGYSAFFLAPTERTMREIQRIFYIHLSSAWTALLAFFLVFIANIAYVATRRAKWDWLGIAAAEVGVAFCTVVLLTGPIWAKPVWGIWWTWDARLTSTFVLWLLYVSYLLLRNMLADSDRQAMISAVFGIFAFLDVPLVYLSIWLWRTQHPAPVIGGGGLDARMWRVFLTCWVAFLGVGVILLRQRYRLEALRHEAAELVQRVEAHQAAGGQAAKEVSR